MRDLAAPMTGIVIPLSEMPDPAFASRTLGDGVAIRPKDGRVQSPVTGVVGSIAGHAVTLHSDDGAELLIHVGIDTVNAEGSLFHSHVKAGDRVRVGQLLIEADLDGLRRAGFDTTTAVILRNSAGYSMQVAAKSAVEAGERLIRFDRLRPMTA
jgi:glucose-specific phosphotransferase system IIA component